MKLQVTQPQPTPNISGVTTATSPNISGVVTAASPTTVKVGPLAPTGTVYNPLSQVTPAVQPAAKTKVLMPNTQTATASSQPAASPAALQTFSLGDGSTFNSNGQMINGPTVVQGAQGSVAGAATQFTPPVTMQDNTIPTPTPSTSLTGDGGYGDIMKLLSGNLQNMDKLFSSMSQYATVSPEEQAQQQKVASDSAAMTALGYQSKGLYNPDNQTIALPFLTGQAQNKMVSAGIQAQLDQAVLNYMQGNRQFAFNSASQIFDASRNNLQTMLDVYSKAAPQSLGTNYNPTTGQLTAIMRNPLNGATYTGDLGNIGPQKSFTSTQIATDPMTGALTFVGTTSDGKVIQQPVGGGSVFGGGSISNPLQGGGATGNYTSTGNPQFATTGEVLGNWTSGNPTQLPGQGYQNAVYQNFAKETGIQIDASTPTSTLVSNIPALAKSMAIAEGYNKPTSIQHVTNNPGNILWANQPNATPYTAKNGYTYAKFNTEQDGWNAMNDLLAKKLGASPQTALSSGQGKLPTLSDLKNVIPTLPPALQNPGTIKGLPDGTAYIDGNNITSTQAGMAQAYATKLGIPYVTGENANKLNDISVTMNNLSEFKSFADNNLWGGLGGAGLFGITPNSIKNFLGSALGGTVKTQFDSYRTTALNAIQGLAGGQGSGFRLNAGEIATAVSNLPTISDSRGQADTKIAALNSQMNKWIAQIIPSWSAKNQQNQTVLNTLFTAMMNGNTNSTSTSLLGGQ